MGIPEVDGTSALGVSYDFSWQFSIRRLISDVISRRNLFMTRFLPNINVATQLS